MCFFLSNVRQHQWDSNWDRNGDGVIGTDRDSVLIRHGEYYKSIPPYGLTARGCEQARAAGHYLNSLLARRRLNIHAIVHSELQRAKETASELVGALDNKHSLSCSELLNGLPSVHQVTRPFITFCN